MFDTFQREKLVNAVVFFLTKTKRCHTLKLFKMLYFLDFEHYRQTGRSVTGLQYRALDMGPVPMDLYAELDNPGQDLGRAITISRGLTTVGSHSLRDIRATADFDNRHFSRREIEIMTDLAEMFGEVEGRDMSMVSHLRRLPWRQIYKKGDGRNQVIPYELARTTDPILPTHEAPSDAEFLYKLSNFTAEEK